MKNPLLPAAALVFFLTSSLSLQAASVTLDSVSHSGTLAAERITPMPSTDSPAVSTTGFANDQEAVVTGGILVRAAHSASGSFTVGGTDFTLQASTSVLAAGQSTGQSGRVFSEAQATSIYRFILDGTFGFTLDVEMSAQAYLATGSARDTANGSHISTATVELRRVDIPQLIWSPEAVSAVNPATGAPMFPLSGDGTSGTLGAGVYEIEIGVGGRLPASLGSQSTGAGASASGSFTMTFNAVPESSALLLYGPTLALVVRRNRPSRPS
ncbi:MAG: hypothetical protein KF712_06530 [Akkermansiaceae bacterium]|nr:hypothetical protein [Akkermansiaceae bacterium]